MGKNPNTLKGAVTHESLEAIQIWKTAEGNYIVEDEERMEN